MDLRARWTWSSSERFPRERGDGPPSARTRASRSRFPPRARGWTQDCGEGEGYESVSPASAGMDRPHGGKLKKGERFPRERGDGPMARSARHRFALFPPRARGWTEQAEFIPHPGLVSPASAGMDPPSGRIPAGNPCFPRERGDGPSASRRRRQDGGFPPRARGWTGIRHRLRSRILVSPASAGLDPCADVGGAMLGCFPRERGAGPVIRRAGRYPEMLPPRARGWTSPAHKSQA